MSKAFLAVVEIHTSDEYLKSLDPIGDLQPEDFIASAIVGLLNPVHQPPSQNWTLDVTVYRLAEGR